MISVFTRIRLFSMIILFGVASNCTYGQKGSFQNLNDSARWKAVTLKSQILPGALLTTGILLNLGDVKVTIQQKFPNTHTKVENYLQYVPVVELYAADLSGVKARNTVFDQTKYLFISELFTAAIVHFLKPVANVTRPDGTEHSFPSGHTSQSFASATVLYREFNETSMALACSGYVFSSATGILRITNNHHWLPDVLAGAGIGMVVTNLVYYFQPLKNWHPFQSKRMSFYPAVDYISGTAGIVMVF
jgi:membrane-associated phospholipid phosphatase